VCVSKQLSERCMWMRVCMRLGCPLPWHSSFVEDSRRTGQGHGPHSTSGWVGMHPKRDTLGGRSVGLNIANYEIRYIPPTFPPRSNISSPSLIGR
jgi:hypothetical protein